jgi:DNA-binding PadR family transcriptional regulator
VRRRLVSSREAPRGARKAWLYAITPTGRERFLAWLQPPYGPEIITVPPDPLRTRMHFLGVLPPRQRARMLREAIADLRRHAELLKPRTEDTPDDRRALRGAVLATRTRIEWLTSLHREAEQDAPS